MTLLQCIASGWTRNDVRMSIEIGDLEPGSRVEEAHHTLPYFITCFTHRHKTDGVASPCVVIDWLT